MVNDRQVYWMERDRDDALNEIETLEKLREQLVERRKAHVEMDARLTEQIRRIDEKIGFLQAEADDLDEMLPAERPYRPQVL